MKCIEAVFIDRDGTIGGGEEVIYPFSFKPFSYTNKAINILKKEGIPVFAFTNQPGIARGEAAVEDFEKELKGIGFDSVYLCPHTHEECCACRKPGTGMLEKASKEHGLDLKQSVVIGDRWTDLLAAANAGCAKILVKTGAGKSVFEKYTKREFYGAWADIKPDFIAEHLLEAIEWLVDDKQRGSVLHNGE
ncbi:HAD-IIIA family hydrolase [Falsibacillus albus]|uniref:D,D-heptose 1,7-bisphosphate phosphatase n=1 Tax=Falsibacillus albus TaxID=2478915 RepID=A0A3L7JZF9_9BACI|nr:HAD-IIIA family hydrolase [Falsibacillus albus]RLQ96268.1 HAD-IIIA family hydrolase [Falsibacillus albus]